MTNHRAKIKVELLHAADKEIYHFGHSLGKPVHILSSLAHNSFSWQMYRRLAYIRFHILNVSRLLWHPRNLEIVDHKYGADQAFSKFLMFWFISSYTMCIFCIEGIKGTDAIRIRRWPGKWPRGRRKTISFTESSSQGFLMTWRGGIPRDLLDRNLSTKLNNKMCFPFPVANPLV